MYSEGSFSAINSINCVWTVIHLTKSLFLALAPTLLCTTWQSFHFSHHATMFLFLFPLQYSFSRKKKWKREGRWKKAKEGISLRAKLWNIFQSKQWWLPTIALFGRNDSSLGGHLSHGHLAIWQYQHPIHHFPSNYSNLKRFPNKTKTKSIKL